MYIHIEFGYRMYIGSLAHTHMNHIAHTTNHACFPRIWWLTSRDLIFAPRKLDISLRNWWGNGHVGASDKAGEKIGVLFGGMWTPGERHYSHYLDPSKVSNFSPEKPGKLVLFRSTNFTPDWRIQVDIPQIPCKSWYTSRLLLWKMGWSDFLKLGLFREKDWYRTKGATTQKMR